jgi:serine protease Do
VITRYDGQAVAGPRELSTQVAGTRVGRSVELALVRDGEPRVVRVTIGNLAQSQTQTGGPGPEGRLAGQLGLELEELTPEVARRLGIKPEAGVVVTEVRPGSPAARAGLAEGDVIREVNRTPVRALPDVQQGLGRRGSDPGQVLLRVERQGASRYVVVDIG